jgi:glycerophosphoryl diester phosphodiesterase
MSVFPSTALLTLTVASGLAAMSIGRIDATTHAPQPAGTFVIAHRGASAYAPEHTAAAYRLAIEQGADYVEPDLGLTKDGVLVSTHDGSLERTTDVQSRFPDRFTEIKTGDRVRRTWLVESFTLAEIKSLDAGSWFDPKFKGERMMTFQETIDLVKGKAGLFPELKVPSRFRQKGFEIERIVADALRKNGLVGATLNGRPAVHLQVFEEDSVRRLASVLPDVPRTLLISQGAGASRWLNPTGLAEVKTFATGIGPAYQLIEKSPDIVKQAHAAGLTVVPYTFAMRPTRDPYPDAPAEWRKAIDESMRTLPTTREALTAKMRTFIDEYKVDGMFTDNPDLFPR